MYLAYQLAKAPSGLKKKWPSRLTEDEKARFLTKNERKKRNDMQKKRSSKDSIYFLRDNKALSFFLSERHKLFYNSNYIEHVFPCLQSLT